MIQGDLRLEHQDNALIVRSKHNARWYGALGVGIALIFLIQWTSVPAPSGLALLAYWFGLVIGVVAPAGIGVFLLLPREVITTFDLRCHRVVHHVSIGRGWYERRRTYAFTEIAGLRLNGYDPEPDFYMPVMILRNGETRWLSTANSSYLICAMTIEAICEVTGLQKLGVARQRLWGSWAAHFCVPNAANSKGRRPVHQPQETAKALGLSVPATLFASADEVTRSPLIAVAAHVAGCDAGSLAATSAEPRYAGIVSREANP